MAPVVDLPKFFALYSESAGKYLSYTSEKGKRNRMIAAKGHRVTSPHGKFELVSSEVHPTMVHIRCCYNNKFLARRSENEFWIVAGAEKPEDDHTKWSSTLFDAEAFISTDGKDIISLRLLHVQTGRYAEWCDDSANQYPMCIWLHSTNPAEPKAKFIVADWKFLIELPRVLSFKGSNGRYLGLAEGNDVLQFLYDDPKNVTVVQEVSDVAPNNNNNNGTNILIKNQSNSGMWVTSPGSQAIAEATGNEGVELTAIKVPGGDTVALRHFKTRKFFRSRTQFTVHPLSYYLVADATDIVPDAHLVVTDLLPTRTIDSFKFNLADGWISELTLPEVLNKGEPVINETDETQIVEMKIPYVDTSTKSTFKATTPSFKKGPVAGIKPDQIPYVVVVGTTLLAPRIEMGTPFVSSFLWGGTTPTTIHQVIRHKVKLPPWTKATVELSAMAATCNVPFTYTRYDGESSSETYIMEDGLYTGTNYFDFKFEEKLEPIPKKL